MNDLSEFSSQFAAARAPRVSVVLPVRDATEQLADRIAEVAVEAEFGHLNLCEIIMVDDGSRDLSWAVLQSLARHEPRLRPVRLRRSFGFAAAREAGVLAASGDIIITLEEDAPLRELSRLAGLIEAEHDVIVTRRGPRSWLDGHGQADSGTAAYRREALVALTAGGVALSTLPVAARRAGYRVRDIRIAPGGARDRLGGLAEHLGGAAALHGSERLAGFGVLAGLLVMAMAGVVPLLSLLVAAAGGVVAWGAVALAAAVLFAAGLQIIALSLFAGLLLAPGRSGRVRSRIAETLLGHGARE